MKKIDIYTIIGVLCWIAICWTSNVLLLVLGFLLVILGCFVFDKA